MMVWRKDVIEPALDSETQKHIQEQLAWIAQDPKNAVPYYNLAQLYRMQWKQDEGLALLLEAVSLLPGFAAAHVALTEVYAVREDYRAAWQHARLAETHGDRTAVSLLSRHGVSEPS